jgi:hypothetical protein
MSGNATAEAESNTTRVVGPAGHLNPLTYSPRLVKALTPVEVCGRILKVYAMFRDPGRRSTVPEPDFLQHHVASVLQEPRQPRDHPVGFVILHYGSQGDYLLVSQWYDADMLKHWVRGAVVDAAGATAFAPLAQRDLIACVWELEVIKFERDAWINTVLARGQLDQAALDAYLDTTFSGWV